jgi:hypothetical protein
VKFELNRFDNPKESKVYGKLFIDVAQYFKAVKPVDVQMEMESARNVTPVFNALFSFVSITKQQSGQIDLQDVSFIGDSPDRKINLSEWDVSDAPDLVPLDPTSSQAASISLFEQTAKSEKDRK